MRSAKNDSSSHWRRSDGAAALSRLHLGRLPDHARHERLRPVSGDVLLDFDRDHLGRVHLAVEELDHPAQLARNLVRDEHHPYPPRAQVVRCGLPELLHLDVLTGKRGNDLLGLAAGALALARDISRSCSIGQ